MNDLSKKMKEIDPEFKNFCEETLKITREDFNTKLSKVLIHSDSHIVEIIEAGNFINKLWHYLMGDE